MEKKIKRLAIAVATVTLLAGASFAQECSWLDADCLADDLDDTVEGTWAQPYVNDVTDELREYGDGDPNSDNSESYYDSSDDYSYDSENDNSAGSSVTAW